jgi:hypothetical protein
VINTMQNIQRIPRWLVENDPTWEKTIDTNLSNLKWIKKGTDLKATCSVTSMFCDVVDESNENENMGLIDVSTNFINQSKSGTVSPNDLTRYLSSRYLNPTIDRSTDLRIRKFNLFRMGKF